MFNFIKNKLSELFSRNTLDAATLKELEKTLIEADIGVSTTKLLIQTLQEQARTGADAYTLLKSELIKRAQTYSYTNNARVFLCVGINGSGKTTFIGKLAYHYATQKKRILLIAADTFRAAAREQLKEWAQATGADIFMGNENQDPSSVIFAGCQKFKEESYDILIIDTAGRLQTKTHLMKELEKMVRTMHRQLPDVPYTTLLTIDAMLGQNSLEQAQLFNECTKLDGIVLTKYDGTGKGGIIFPIIETLKIPIAYISHGEKKEDLMRFDASLFVTDLIEK